MKVLKFKNFIHKNSILLIIILLFNGCSLGGDEGLDCSFRWAMELQSELGLVSSTAIAYGQNDTEANCEAYRAALQDYLNELRPYGNCQALTGQDRDEFQASLDDAQEELDALNCAEQ